MEVDTIKVLGERSSGTTLLELLLRTNTSIRVVDNSVSPRFKEFFAKARRHTSPRTFHRVTEPMRDLVFMRFLPTQYGWKHMAVTAGYLEKCPPNVALVAVTKDPYAWLLSLYRHPYHRKPLATGQKQSFSEFLRHPWPTIRRDHGPREFANPVDLWNAKTRSYGLLSDRPHSVVVRYETLIEDMPRTVETIATACRFPLNEQITVPERDVKRANKRSTTEIGDFYRSRAFLEQYSDEALRFVNDRLDPVALQVGGYEIMPSSTPS